MNLRWTHLALCGMRASFLIRSMYSISAKLSHPQFLHHCPLHSRLAVSFTEEKFAPFAWAHDIINITLLLHCIPETTNGVASESKE